MGFLQPQDRSGANQKIGLDLPNYATKADLKGATGIDTSIWVACR